MRYGGPDGHGRYGILDTDPAGLLICHDCGKVFRHLATHARLAHGYGSAEGYREAHGLARSVRLVAAETSGKMSARWEESRPEREQRLAEVRDPQRAWEASKSTALRVGARAGRAQSAKRRQVDLTPEQVERLGDWFDIPEWARRARRLMESDGVGTRALARAFGVSQGAVEGRLRRYP